MFSEILRLTYLNASAQLVSLLGDDIVGRWIPIMALVFIVGVVLAY